MSDTIISTGQITLQDITDYQNIDFFLEGNQARLQVRKSDGTYEPNYEDGALIITPYLYNGITKGDVDINNITCTLNGVELEYLGGYDDNRKSNTNVDGVFFIVVDNILSSIQIWKNFEDSIILTIEDTKEGKYYASYENLLIKEDFIESEIEQFFCLGTDSDKPPQDAEWDKTPLTTTKELPFLWSYFRVGDVDNNPFIAAFYVDDGADGIGVQSIIDQYYTIECVKITDTALQIFEGLPISSDINIGYVSLNKVDNKLYLKEKGKTEFQEILNESWKESPEGWNETKYLYSRSKITYTNGEVAYTNPICDPQLSAIQSLRDTISGIQDNLQQQLDSKIQTWMGIISPLDKNFTNPWDNEDNLHIGDIYLDTTTGITYIYTETGWRATTEDYSDVLGSTIFYGMPTDNFEGVETGDLLITPSGEMYKYDGNDWQLVNGADYLNINIYYGLSNSPTLHGEANMYKNNGVSWFDTLTITASNYPYVWQKIVRTKRDGSEDVSYSCISNAIKSVKESKNYYLATETSDQPAANVVWSDTRPTLTSAKPYLWNYNETTYSPDGIFAPTKTTPTIIDTYREVPVSVEVTADSWVVLQHNEEPLTPNEINLTATLSGFSNSRTIEWYKNGDLIQNAKSITLKQNTEENKNVYRCVVTEGGRTAEDTVTIGFISTKDGQDGQDGQDGGQGQSPYSIILTNEYTTVPTLTETQTVSIKTTASTDVIVYKGIAQISNFDIKINGTLHENTHAYSETYSVGTKFEQRKDVEIKVLVDNVEIGTKVFTIAPTQSIPATFKEANVWRYATHDGSKIDILNNATKVEFDSGKNEFIIRFNEKNFSVGWTKNSNPSSLSYDINQDLLYEIDETVYENSNKITYGLPQLIAKPTRNEIISIENYYKLTTSEEAPSEIITKPSLNTNGWETTTPSPNAENKFLWVQVLTTKYEKPYGNSKTYEVSSPRLIFRYTEDGTDAVIPYVYSMDGRAHFSSSENGDIVLCAQLISTRGEKVGIKSYEWLSVPDSAYNVGNPLSTEETLEVKGELLKNAATFICKMTTNNDVVYQSGIQIIDKEDVLVAQITSSAGDKFNTGVIDTTLKCELRDLTSQEIVGGQDTPYVCYWQKGNNYKWKNNNFVTDWECHVNNDDVGIKEVFYAIILNKSDVDGKTDSQITTALNTKSVAVGEYTIVDLTDFASSFTVTPSVIPVLVNSSNKPTAKVTQSIALNFEDEYGDYFSTAKYTVTYPSGVASTATTTTALNSKVNIIKSFNINIQTTDTLSTSIVKDVIITRNDDNKQWKQTVTIMPYKNGAQGQAGTNGQPAYWAALSNENVSWLAITNNNDVNPQTAFTTSTLKCYKGGESVNFKIISWETQGDNRVTFVNNGNGQSLNTSTTYKDLVIKFQAGNTTRTLNGIIKFVIQPTDNTSANLGVDFTWTVIPKGAPGERGNDGNDAVVYDLTFGNTTAIKRTISDTVTLNPPSLNVGVNKYDGSITTNLSSLPSGFTIQVDKLMNDNESSTVTNNCGITSNYTLGDTFKDTSVYGIRFTLKNGSIIYDVQTIPFIVDDVKIQGDITTIIDSISTTVQDLSTFETTTNNKMWQDDGKRYIYFGNKELYGNAERITATRLANNAFAITLNQSTNVEDGQDEVLAEFNPNSLMLSRRYALIFNEGYGLYFQPLIED